MYFDRPLVRAYVDETGDRGLTPRSSRYFGMVAVVLADEDDAGMRRAIAECRRRLSVPANLGVVREAAGEWLGRPALGAPAR